MSDAFLHHGQYPGFRGRRVVKRHILQRNSQRSARQLKTRFCQRDFGTDSGSPQRVAWKTSLQSLGFITGVIRRIDDANRQIARRCRKTGSGQHGASQQRDAAVAR